MTSRPVRKHSALLCSMHSTASGRSMQQPGSWRAMLMLGHSPQALIATLGRALLREDAGFHAYQMFEAGVRQFAEWGDTARAGTSSSLLPLSRSSCSYRAVGLTDGRDRTPPDARCAASHRRSVAVIQANESALGVACPA